MKIFKLMLTLIFILGLTLTSYATDGTISIGLDASEVEVNDIITVKVLLEDVIELKGIDIKIKYDNTYLESINEESTIGNLLENKSFFTAVNKVDNISGHARFIGTIYDKNQSIHGNGTLINLKFKALKIGTTRLELSDVKLIDSSLNEVDVGVLDNEFEIKKTASSNRDYSPNLTKDDRNINITGNNVDNLTINKGVIPNNTNNELTLTSEVYEVVESTSKEYTVIEPFNINIKYEPQDGIDINQLGIYYFNVKRNDWVFLGGDINLESATIAVMAQHATQYAVFTSPTIKKFNDMDEHWSTSYVKRLTGMNIINGFKDSTFRPSQEVTRQEFAKIIVSSLALEKSVENLEFKDKGQAQPWAIDYIDSALGNNILTGYEDGTFKPNKPMRRIELATALGRLLPEVNEDYINQYNDSHELPSWSIEAINKCISYRILNGYEDNTLRPNDTVTRAEAAKMIYQLLWVLGI